MYDIDSKNEIRRSHENESIKTLYKEFLIEPNSERAHNILHTHYFDKSKINRN